MSEDDHGIKWWIGYVVVPLIVGSGILTIIVNSLMGKSPQKNVDVSPIKRDTFVEASIVSLAALPPSPCTRSEPCSITTETRSWAMDSPPIILELVAIDIESSPLSPVAYFRNSIGRPGFNVTGSGDVNGNMLLDSKQIPIVLSIHKIVVDHEDAGKTEQNVSGKVVFSLDY